MTDVILTPQRARAASPLPASPTIGRRLAAALRVVAARLVSPRPDVPPEFFRQPYP